MRKNIIPFILISPLILSAFLYAEKNPNLPQRYKKWLEEEVVYIITSKEEKVFKQLETDKQRDLFMEEFWRQRDPTPGTPQNEFRDEHYRRIEYANRFFSRGTPKPGWKTERGRVYIILGEPISRDRFPNSHYIYPTEMWFYQGNVSQGLPPFFYLVFFKRWGAGDFELYSPLRDGTHKLLPATSHELSPPERSFADSQRMRGRTAGGGVAYEILKERVSAELADATLSLIPGSHPPVESDRLLGEVNSYPQRSVDDEYTYEFLEHKGVVEVSHSVYYIGNTSVVKIIQDEPGLFFVHYSIEPQNLSVNAYEDKYYSNIKITGRVTDSKGKTVFQYEKEYPLEFSKEQIKQVKLIPMAIQDSFPLVPGNYKFNLLLQNTVSKEFTSLEREIIIPESREAFWMGDLVFAFGGKKDKESLKSSFKVGETRLYPCLRKEFTPQDTLYLFFQLYGLSEELREGGWVKYTFFKGGKEQHVKKREIKEYGIGMNFFEEFPLLDFPPSRYLISVSVLNKDEQEVLFREESFTVASEIYTRPWIQFKRYPGSGDPVYSFTRGVQLLNKGEMEKAEDELGKAYEMDPEREDFAIVYAGALLTRGANEDVKRMLMPFVEKQLSDDNLYYILGRAHQGLGEYEEAISFYLKYISHQGVSFAALNSIGECYFQLQNHKEALRAWEKSLEINPDQPEIKKKVEGIKKKQ
ncbi:MAG: GWxTD domain-containing protein [Candidatus Aminicenantes bacterium]|nr:GWxTD domain-containing protein [Candidatus Aminicenantes bacterium]